MGGGIGLFWVTLLILSAGTGLFVALAKPPEFVAWINDKSGWWDRHYASVKEKDGLLAGTWAALIWGVHKLHQGTESIADEANRAGTRFALFFCVISVSLIVIASLIYLAIVIAMIVIGFWVLSKLFEDGDKPTEQEPERRRTVPKSARDGRSRQRTGWFGNEYTEHLDEDGRPAGRSEIKKDWLGNTYVETRNAAGDIVETSRDRQDWFGADYVEHRDAEGDKTGESRERQDWFGADYVEHRDAEGVEQGRSRERSDWFGNDYTEHEKKE